MRKEPSESADDTMEALKQQRVALNKISSEQRQEIEDFQNIDYSKFPIQPGVKSVFFLSKIAQQQ